MLVFLPAFFVGWGLSVVYDKGIADVVDSVTVEGTASRTIRDIAYIVQVIGASTTVAFCITTYLQLKGFGDAVVLIAVGTGSVIAHYTHIVLTYLGDGELPNDEAVQPQIVAIVAADGKDVDGRSVIPCIREEEPLSVACNSTILTHTLTGSIEDGSLCDVLNGQSCGQVAELIVHLAFLAGK